MTESLKGTMEFPLELQAYLVKLVGIGVVSYAAVVLLIPIASRWLPAKLSGKDLCKKGTPAGDIPMYVRLFVYTAMQTALCGL